MRDINYLEKFVEDFFDRKWMGRLDLSMWRSLESKLLAQAARRVGVGERSKIFDIGCGDGYFTSNIFDREHVVGTDIIQSDLETARRYPVFERLLPNDVTRRTPLEDNSVDFAFSNCVLEHIPAIDDAIGEIARTVKPGGWLFLSVPAECFAENIFLSRLVRPLSRSAALRIAARQNARFAHYNLLPPSRWKEKLSRAGFTHAEMLKYFDHREYLLWDLFRHYLPNKFLRIFAALFGKRAAMRIALACLQPSHDRYNIGQLGEVDDACTHNGLFILCRKGA
jgi:SAM-dependent methyltransferase